MEDFSKELSEMTIEEVLKRKAELEIEIRSAENTENLEDMDKKIELIEARISELKEIEERAKAKEELENGAKGKIKEKREEEHTMTIAELRDSVEYRKAFAKAILGNDDTELRALLTDNVEGTVPVPTFLDTEIKNAWENHALMSLVKTTNYKGNIKVGFEYSSTGASIHVEGTDALEGTTVDMLDYIYKELAQKIAEKAEEVLIDKIVASPAASTTTACGVPVLAENPAVDTVVKAVAMLSAQARNLNIAMNRQTYPMFVSLALKAGYAIDVFDGLKDKIVFTDKLKAFSSASATDTYMIIGDFGYGAQKNLPNGNDLTIKIDDKSLAEKDLVKIVGREYVGIGVVAPNSFVKVNKVNEG
ncbi:MAG: phage major capsid protein [Clostridia bacterium]|nr:phage major capsid protein [Clostridia bacterium]